MPAWKEEKGVQKDLGVKRTKRSCLEPERKEERTREGNEEGEEEKPLHHEPPYSKP